MDNFTRRLQEATATLGNVGTAPPPIAPPEDGDDGDDGDDSFNVKALYEWVKANSRLVTRPVIGVLEQAAPKIEAVRIRTSNLADTAIVGEATITASWSSNDTMALMQALKPALYKSDLWKALGVTYEAAYHIMANPQFEEHLLRAVQYTLNQDGNAAFWLYERQQEATTAAQRAVASHLERISQGKYKIGEVKLKATGKPVQGLSQGYAVPHRLTGEPGRGMGIESQPLTLTVAASLNFGFVAYISTPQDEALGDLRWAARDVVAKLGEAVDMAWEEIGGDIYVDVSYGGYVSDWEPKHYQIEMSLAQVLGELQEETELNTATIQQLLTNPPKHLLTHTKRQYEFTTESGRDQYTLLAELQVLGSEVRQGVLVVIVGVKVY